MIDFIIIWGLGFGAGFCLASWYWTKRIKEIRGEGK